MIAYSSNLRPYLQVYLTLICFVLVPCVAFGIEPIAMIGQPSPEKHAFLTNNTLLRTFHLNGTKFQIVDRDTGEIIDEFGMRPNNSEVVISPNATHLAILDSSVAGKTSIVTIWDVNRQEQISEWEIAYSTGIAVFSPVQPLLATTNNDEIDLWDWQTGEPIGKLERENLPPFRGMVFSADGDHLIVASRDNLELWNVKTHTLEGHFEEHGTEKFDGLIISPNGTRIASFAKESMLFYVWDAATRQLLLTDSTKHEICSMVFSADGKYLYVVDKRARIWDVNIGQQVGIIGNEYYGLKQLVLSPDGKSALLQYWMSFVELWNTESNKQIKVFADFTAGVFTGRVLELSPDGQTMVTVDFNAIKIWDILSGKVRFRIPGVYQYNQKGIAISPDNKRIAYIRYPWIEVADIQNGNVEMILPVHIGYIRHAKFSRSGKWLATVDDWGDLDVLDLILEERQNIQIDFNVNEIIHQFYQVAFSKNDEYMAASLEKGFGNTAQYWILLWKRNEDNFEFQYRWETPEPNRFLNTSLAFASTEDGSTVLAAAGEVNTELWKILPQNAMLVNTLMGAKAPIYFSPNKRYLFTNKYNELQIWDWQKSRPINFPSIPNYRAFSEDGSVLVSSDKIGRYLIWDAKDVFSSLPYPVEPKGKQIVTLGQIKRDQLLQNYPNPFNPETWIPFRLANKSSVAIHIYTQTGKLVRSLSPGIMSAGDYSSQSKALHWDGRNEKGEPVSSGVYLYTINAGEFSATRKCLLGNDVIYILSHPTNKPT